MAQKTKREGSNSFGELVRTIFYALLIALSLRTLLFQPFSIPSSSMVPTLLIGDYLFVSKSAYGFSHQSLPFRPKIFEGRIMAKQPERGDVIVFNNQLDQNKDYIKRLIGLPGDRIQMISGVLHINGKAVKMESAGFHTETLSNGVIIRQPKYIETLPNGRSYEILDTKPRGHYDNTREFVVREGHYFFMGDNRDNSSDSRTHLVQQVPFEMLVGEAKIVFISTNGFFLNPLDWRTDRLVTKVR